jgi:hypothetical protein
MRLADGAVSGRLRSMPVSQAMVFVPLGLGAGTQALGLLPRLVLWTAALATMLAPDAALGLPGRWTVHRGGLAAGRTPPHSGDPQSDAHRRSSRRRGRPDRPRGRITAGTASTMGSSSCESWCGCWRPAS